MKNPFASFAVAALLLSTVWPPNASGGVVELTSPGQFTGTPTKIGFDDAPDQTPANTRYSSLGVTFSRDDGHPVWLYNWAALGRATTSPPNVLATIEAGNWTTYLNLTFANSTFELGAFFGNDQTLFGSFSYEKLTVFDASHVSLGSVLVATNNNTDVDQFIGLRSDIPFKSARFENIGNTYYAVALDDLVFGGNTIPEPSAIVIWALVGGLGIAMGKIWGQSLNSE